MRIVLATGLDQGIYEYCNMGDVAMLQVGATRLMRLWPSASLEVLTQSPVNLATYCPGTKPLASAGCDLWFSDLVGLGPFTGFLPRPVSIYLAKLRKAVGMRWPTLLSVIIRLKLSLRGRGDDNSEIMAAAAFLEAVNNADLFVLCGAGGFVTHCRGWNMTILNTLEVAIRRKIPVVMMGQGMGPLTDPEVLSRAKSIVPRVHLITLRGNRGGLALVQSLGVAPSRVETTGDESIELAYEARPKELGQAVGINFRICESAETDQADIERVRPVMHEFARRHAVAMIPVPIAIHQYSRDDLLIKQLLAGYDDESDGGITLDSPLKVIKQAGRCRVLVTGAYHAAVFALAQGIPVVGLAKSPYFASKFLGLEDQFGLGCETVFLNEPDVSEKLAAAIERAWQSAEMVRLPLQQAALRQIELSRSAYERLRDLLNSHGAEKPAIGDARTRRGD